MADNIEQYAQGGAAAVTPSPEHRAGTPGQQNGNGNGEESRTMEEAAGGGNKFQQAVAAWRSLDLTNLVSALDTTAADMVDQQKESLIKRKELAAKTKDFRKSDDATKLADVMGLLKMYQSYIDLVSNQNKAVSAAFMSAYSPLSDAPDPYPLLEASIDSLVTADEVVPRLESENERLQKQLSKQNSQLEDLEKQLESERSKRQSFEGSQDTKLKEVQDSWSAVVKEKEDNWAAKEKSLEEKVENQDRLLKELKASYEVSQRLEKSGEDSQDSGRNAAAAAELEVVTSELEKTSLRLAEIEARNEQLRVDLAQATSQSHNSARSTAVEDDPAYLRLRSENSSLLRRLDSARYDREADKASLENKMRSLERELNTLKADRETLQSKVQRWSNYDEVKRELDMLRAIEFSTVEDIDETGAGENSTSNGGTTGESLEKLLVARNKKLSDDLTEMRVSHKELQQRLEQLQEDLSSTNMELEKTQSLNATLENDLQKTQQEASNAFETMSVAGTYTSRYPKSTYGSRRGRGASPTSSIIGGFESGTPGSESPRMGSTLETLRAGEAGTSGTGILPMVTAQRDRFKKKMGELEQDLQKQYHLVSNLRSEVASLQRDNLNLYEKTRYVSSYNRSTATAYPSSSSAAPSQGEDRYKSAYEANISPFQAFRGRESARALKRMSIPERAVFQLTRMVLATRTSRNLFAGYCLALHCLVFLLLYWMGSVDTAASASSLSTSSLAEHAAAVAAAGGAEDHGNWKAEGFEAGG